LESNERLYSNPNCYSSCNHSPNAIDSYGIAGGGYPATSEKLAHRVEIQHGVALQHNSTYAYAQT
jgi:hypothetical protein